MIERHLTAAERERERIRQAARDTTERSRREQGLPPKLEDRKTLEAIAALVREESEWDAA
jgi:hypothetical protein